MNRIVHNTSANLRSSEIPSERSFGILFSFVFAFAAAYCAYTQLEWAAIITLLAISMGTFSTAILRPAILVPFNSAWYRLGLALGHIVSPVVIGLIFFCLISPVALAMSIARRDALRLKKQNVTTYWIDREPPGPHADSFKNQF